MPLRLTGLMVLGLFAGLLVRPVAADVTPLVKPTGGLVSNTAYAVDAPPGSSSPNVAWVGKDASGNAGIFSKPAGGSVITIMGSSFSTTPVGPISMSNGVIAFRGIDSAGTNNGVYTVPVSGGIVITIIGSNFNDATGAPVINAGGTVAFKDQQNNVQSIYASPASGGVVITIHGDPFGQMSRPSINNAGDIAVVATTLGSSQPNAYVRQSGGGTLLTITGSDLTMNSSQPKIIDNEKVLVVGGTDPQTGNNGLDYIVYDPPTDSYRKPVRAYTAGKFALDFSVNQGGEVLASDGQSIDLLTNISQPGDVPDFADARLFSLGDPLDGSTITSLAISDSAMLNNGNIAFYAGLADGSSGIYYDTVPEPASLIAAPFMLWVLSRRRRHA